MEDIEVVGNYYVKDSFQSLEKTFDRVKASICFANSCAKYSDSGNEELARWYYRAMLSEYKSIYDVLSTDFKKLNLHTIWERSEFRTNINNHQLIKILKKARDLSIHSENLRGDAQTYKIIIINESGEKPKSITRIFIDEIDKSMINERQKKGKTSFSDDDIIWFNRQTKIWPSDLLVIEAIYETSIHIANFLMVNKEMRHGDNK